MLLFVNSREKKKNLVFGPSLFFYMRVSPNTNSCFGRQQQKKSHLVFGSAAHSICKAISRSTHDAVQSVGSGSKCPRSIKRCPPTL